MQFALARNGQQKSERGTFYWAIKSESSTVAASVHKYRMCVFSTKYSFHFQFFPMVLVLWVCIDEPLMIKHKSDIP